MTNAQLPPPNADHLVDPEQAARLARLASRRPSPATGASAPAADAAQADRLARLASRRGPAAGATPAAGTPAPTAGPTKARRRHAAKGSRAAALALSVATSGGLAGLFAHEAAASTASAVGTLSASTATGTGTAASTGTAAASTGTAAATSATAATATTAAATSGAAATTAGTAAAGATAAAATSTGTATYTGSAVSTRYGVVQVAITTANGKITEVQAVSLPSGGKNDAYSNKAAPVLRTEAIAAQSANIDIVTGATYTSNGYKQSLQVAIDEAVTAGALAG